MAQKKYGTVKITQARTSGPVDGGSFKYIVNTSLSNPQDFESAAILERSPEAIFLFRYDADGIEEYVRLCTISDYFKYRAFTPNIEADTDGFFYFRKSESERTFDSPGESLSYSRQVYESINNFYLTLRDYEQTVDNVVETDTLPNVSSSILYQTIQDYLTIQDEQAALTTTLNELNAKKTAYTEAITMMSPVYEFILQDDIKQTVYDNRQVFTNIKGSVQLARDSIVNPGKLQEVAENLDDIMGKVNDIALTSTASIKNKWDAIKGYLDSSQAVDYYEDKLDLELAFNKLEQTYSTSTISFLNQKILFDSNLTEVNNKITSALNTTIDQETNLDTSSSTLNQFISLSRQLYKQFIASIESINSQLETKQDELTTIISAKQVLAAKLVDLAPDIKLSDPMSVYNHRIFKWKD